MNKILAMALKAALVGLMALYPNLGAMGTAKAAPAAGTAPSVFAKTGTLKGILVDQTSGKPIANKTLTVLDANGKTVASAVTDKDGKFSLPDLQPGEYRLVMGDGLELKLTVADNGTTNNLKIVVPSNSEGLAPGLIEGPAIGAANWTYIALAGVTAAILVPSGFAIAAAGNGGDDGHD